MDQRLTDFIAACTEIAAGHPDAGDCVAAIAPLMQDLAAAGTDLLAPGQMRDDPDRYARNALHVGGADEISLFALVWRPGQWTPIHDHGTWGVVGVLSGVLEERAFLPEGGGIDDAAPIVLQPGGIVLLAPGSVSTFVPNPDHIHLTGVDANRAKVVSLHLYGRHMSSYHFYDRDRQSRRRVDVAHFESR